MFALAVTALLAGCEDSVICGGPCTYVDIPGTATIRSVTPDTSPPRTCTNTVTVIYDFAPEDPTAVDRYRIPSWPDTGRTLSFPDGWADKEGITPGSEHLCIRREITRGTCTPVIFEFPDFDMSDVEDYCE
jgi:hypothetical protein